MGWHERVSDLSAVEPRDGYRHPLPEKNIMSDSDLIVRGNFVDHNGWFADRDQLVLTHHLQDIGRLQGKQAVG